MAEQTQRPKVTGRAFYESIGSPKMVLAPMVDQSEFAWRMLTRSFLPPEIRLLSYTPMIHARLFAETPQYRTHNLETARKQVPPHGGNPTNIQLDGNPQFDRPLIVQFCANDPDVLLQAARHVEPFCDAVDLNLGCPQGIARKGRYGAFLQDEQDTIYRLINNLHKKLSVPVTAKIRILDTREKTLDYAKMVLSAGTSIITVHGRQRDQKGHKTGLADWNMIRYLRENLPADTVIFANGNILQHHDIQECLDATGADGVMSAEANLYDPTVFAEPPPVGSEGREYWRGRDGKGGFRMDAVLRRYLDIIYKFVMEREPPEREPLFIVEDLSQDRNEKTNGSTATIGLGTTIETSSPSTTNSSTTRAKTRSRDTEDEGNDEPQSSKKKLKKEQRRKGKREARQKYTSPNLTVIQPHLFKLLRALVTRHTHVRDALASCRNCGMESFEEVLRMVEEVTKSGILEYEREREEYGEGPPRDAVDEGYKSASSTKSVAGASENLATAKMLAGPGEINTEATFVTADSSPEHLADKISNPPANPAATSTDLENKDAPTASIDKVEACKRPWWVCQPHVRPLPHEALAKGAISLSKKEMKEANNCVEQKS
ncbi:MAG: hypothetical protein M1831_001053 [Alyxoria varia]|nr:MAG: hypothetical protein M1831_001053 [Alyxoria varia]